MRLDESNKKKEFFKKQFSSHDEKVKSLDQKLVEPETKLENLSSIEFAVESISISIKPKANNVYIPHFKRNHKQKAYFTRIEMVEVLM